MLAGTRYCTNVASAKGSITPPSERRTQAERRSTTRAALLDAAVSCLVANGYANTTTRRIAERAGVTPGALQHHFGSKAELLAATVPHIRAKWVAELFGAGPPKTRSPLKRQEELLDRMWAIYRGSLFQAFLELGTGARTDPDLRRHLVGAHDEMTRVNEMAGPIIFPEYADRPELAQLIATGQATMRGLVLVGGADADRQWPITRDHILAMNAAVLEDPALAPTRRLQRNPTRSH